MERAHSWEHMERGSGRVAHRQATTKKSTFSSDQKRTSLSSKQEHIKMNSNRSGKIDPGTRRGKIKAVVKSSAFQKAIGVAVIVSVIELGFVVQYPKIHRNTMMKVLENLLLMIFACEIALKMVVWRWRYLNSFINIADVVVLCQSIFDAWVTPFITHNNGDFITWTGTLRLLRLLKMVRVMRLHRKLIIVVEGMENSIPSMVWIMILLGSLIYGCAIFCVILLGRNQEFHDEFGNIPTAMLTMFNMMLLDGWSSVIAKVAAANPEFILFFIVYLTVTSFGLINVLIGVIVENTNKAALNMQQQDLKKKVQHKVGLVSQLAELVRHLDADSDGTLTPYEFSRALQSDGLFEFLNELDMPKGLTIEDLYNLLDRNATGMLTQKEFIDGMYRIVHDDVSQQMIMLQVSLAHVKVVIKEAHDQMANHMETRFTEMRDEIQKLWVSNQTTTLKEGGKPSAAGGSWKHGLRSNNQLLAESERCFDSTRISEALTQYVDKNHKSISASPSAGNLTTVTENPRAKRPPVHSSLTFREVPRSHGDVILEPVTTYESRDSKVQFPQIQPIGDHAHGILDQQDIYGRSAPICDFQASDLKNPQK